MKRPLAVSLILIAIAVLAYYTKPANDQCLREAEAQYQNQLLNRLQTPSGSVNEPLLKQTLLKAFEESVSVEDKVIYKSIQQKSGGKTVNIGWGAFGKVSVKIK